MTLLRYEKTNLDKKSWSEVFQLYINSARDSEIVPYLESTIKRRSLQLRNNESPKDRERWMEEMKPVKAKSEQWWYETHMQSRRLSEYIFQWWYGTRIQRSPSGEDFGLLHFIFADAKMKAVLWGRPDGGPGWADFSIRTDGVWRNSKGEVETREFSGKDD